MSSRFDNFSTDNLKECALVSGILVRRITRRSTDLPFFWTDDLPLHGSTVAAMIGNFRKVQVFFQFP